MLASLPRTAAAALLGMLLAASARAHPVSAEAHKIEFPDLPDYQTLVCDFHQHTVFSDGRVWPSLRVEEALRDGLDAISITDHLEYQPHAADIPHPDRNRGYAIASQAAAKHPILVVPGAEVTRDLPPGHCNAIFIDDANKLLVTEPLDAFREAKRQGAFVFWNHPSWLKQKPDGIAQLTPLHEQLLAEGLIQGIEVVGEHDYSDESLQIALDRNLTIMGNSDIHGLIAWSHDETEDGHRPVTLVFARDKTPEALKEALLARRTAVWFKNTLIGRAEWIDPLLAASLRATSPGYGEKDSVLQVVLSNRSDADFILRNLGPYRLHRDIDVFEVKAHTEKTILVKTVERRPTTELRFQVLNAVTAPETHPTMTFKIDAAVAVQ
jgi:hypothetical protein